MLSTVPVYLALAGFASVASAHVGESISKFEYLIRVF